MTRRFHVSVNIQGLLEMHRRRKITMLLHDDGRTMTDAEARQYLYDALSEGKRVLPCSDECDAFDYQNGCPGHIINETESVNA
jgi:hypothetical protein